MWPGDSLLFDSRENNCVTVATSDCPEFRLHVWIPTAGSVSPHRIGTKHCDRGAVQVQLMGLCVLLFAVTVRIKFKVANSNFFLFIYFFLKALIELLGVKVQLRCGWLHHRLAMCECY